MSLQAFVVGFVKKFTDDKGQKLHHVVIELPDPETFGYPTEEQVIVAHDYVRFHGAVNIQQSPIDDKGNYPVKNTHGACNWIPARGDVTISIRDMFDIVMPYLNNHPYLQAKHFEERTDSESGKPYPAYCYSPCVLHYRDVKTETAMVAFRRTGESKWERVSLELFNIIKDSLKLNEKKP